MLDAYRDLIDELLDTPNVVRGIVEAQAERDAPPEAKRLVAEMRDRDRAVLSRVQSITRHDMPYLRALRSEEPSTDEDVPQLLEAMESARGDLVSLLINLSLKDWERRAIHESGGEISLADEVEQHVEFDEDLRRRLRELTT